MLEALGLAKQHLVKGAEDLIAHIQHRRNLAAPIHQLPQEIFGMILEKFAANKNIDCEDGLLQLLQVGRIWYHAIVNSPQLWTALHSNLKPRMARLVIERSKDLPILTLIWNTAEYYDDTEEEDEEYEEILGMAVQNSARFRSIYLRVSADTDQFDILPLLEGPTPALEALKVEMVTKYGGGEDESLEFVLSKGAPLKYLTLDDISLNFNSPRLSGLVILSLSRAAVPNSLGVLLQVLSETQRLEKLALCEKKEISEPVAPGSQVTLGHLKELAIEEMTSEYCTALLSSIYTPVCSRVHVSDSQWGEAESFDPLIWKTGNGQTAALLGLVQHSETRDLRISITAEFSVVRIRFRKQQGGSRRFFSFEGRQASQMLGIMVEALGLAKLHLVKGAEDLISRIQHHRNLAAPIHQLPQEIFGMILEKFAYDRPIDGEHGLLQLLRVGRLWYHTIVSAPRLWSWFDASFAPEFARLIMERSKDLPILSLIWDTYDGWDGRDEEQEEILEMAVQNSMRFRSINLRLSRGDPFKIRSLLEGPTPALEALRVEVSRKDSPGEDGLEEFVLSQGGPLESLELDDTSLNFDSPRLSGLRILTLSRSAVPNSLDVLLQVLSVTQRLEQLSLSDKRRVGGPLAPGPQVTLGRLKRLTIDDITSNYGAAILCSIYAPVSSHVRVSDSRWSGRHEPLDRLIWRTGNSQTAALLGLHQRSDMPVLLISITAEFSLLKICVYEQEGDGPRFFNFERPPASQMVSLLGEFFSGIPSYPPIDLTISTDIPRSDPFDLTPWSGRLKSLVLSCSFSCLRAMEQLAQRTVTPTASETVRSVTAAEDWMCPNLKSITFYIMGSELSIQRKLYLAALLSLVRTRWSQTDGGPIPAIQPTKFAIDCDGRDFKELKDVEIEVQNVVPSFVFQSRR
ncbi:hypothetical protein FRC01_012054 [Tulasnella sp. 417]|nr:hypothetical protein FRC01_012054 [Tulasnella sp. 417]